MLHGKFSRFSPVVPMAVHVVSNPEVPMMMPFPGGVFLPGSTVFIECEPHANCRRIGLKLVNRSNMSCMFRLDFRFDENVTVRSCNFAGCCDEEEPCSLTVGQGRPFLMEIDCCHDRYSVRIDDVPYCYFRHRTWFSAANALQIEGDANIRRIRFRNSVLPPIRLQP